MSSAGTRIFKLKGLYLIRDAKIYLPAPADIHGNPWITCHVASHDQQRAENIRMFDSLRVGRSIRRLRFILRLRLGNGNADEFNGTKEGFIFSAGGPIWGLDWCPYPESKAAGPSAWNSSGFLTLSRLPIRSIPSCLTVIAYRHVPRYGRKMGQKLARRYPNMVNDPAC